MSKALRGSSIGSQHADIAVNGLIHPSAMSAREKRQSATHLATAQMFAFIARVTVGLERLHEHRDVIVVRAVRFGKVVCM